MFLGRRANAMSKKLLWIVVITFFLLFAGWLVYRRMARVSPPSSPVVSQWPTSVPPAAAPPSASSSNSASPPSKPSEPVNKPESSTVQPGFVLRPGETLDYDANIAKLNSTVATLKISAVEKRNSAGKGAWHLRAIAHTENPYRMVFELDDQFDSYSDAGSMASVQYEMHLNERGQKVDSIERMLTSMQEPIPAAGSGVRVPPGTRDPIGMLEYLRGVDWAHTPELHSPVFDGRKLYDVRAVYEGKASAIKVPAGTFNTIKIELHVLDNGQEMKDAHFLLYLTNDAARLPVLLEAVLPIATARVELTKAKE
jgi:Protein of unknown function (DUF3108)